MMPLAMGLLHLQKKICKVCLRKELEYIAKEMKINKNYSCDLPQKIF